QGAEMGPLLPRREQETKMATINVVRPKGVVRPPRANQGLLAFAENVEQKTTNSQYLPNAGAVIGNLAIARKAFATALANQKEQKHVSDALTLAKQGVIKALGHLADYVNSEAEKAPPDQAKAMIESAGLRVKKVVVRVHLPLEVKYGGLAGVV